MMFLLTENIYHLYVMEIAISKEIIDFLTLAASQSP